VTAFAVDHGEKIHPAFGYRVDYAGRSVVLSGDTRFDENLIKHAMGVDLLVHEVAISADALRGQPNIEAILNHHVTAEQAGTVFSRTKPKLAAYSHIILIGDASVTAPTVADLEAQTRRTYDGPLLIGEDLTRIVIGDDVTVQKYDRQAGGFR
jgi:ribonuclease Z